MWLHPGTPRLAATGSSRDQRVAGDGAAPQPHRGRVRGRRARSTAVADDVGRRLRDHAARVVHHEGGRQGGASVTIPCPPPTPLPFTSLSGWAAAPNTASSKPTATLTATASAARPSHSPPECQLAASAVSLSLLARPATAFSMCGGDAVIPALKPKSSVPQMRSSVFF